ncbi:hypothetical protein [Polynucleobacter brandtiae]|uniref:Polysaccharide chain length determinant N-terminal domain-containing protein n=1 Tax=Polynucleobacter brandtiae TaxID=1938816 RepID=A0A2M8VR31_9BURK|nr:hypothetical protein [Polynucleobacter brandtiae]PJI79922.1 hypothetical protein B0G85_0905 [Polynucleobacter brandtiae]
MNQIQSQSQTKEELRPQESEISLLDIVDFTQGAWKKLVTAAVFGLVLGLACWFFLVGYSAQLVLLNNNNNNNYALDIVSWRTVQKSLPNLASQAVEDDGLSGANLAQYLAMSDEAWWQKNVIPTYALSKADTKDLAAIGKDLDGAATTILSLTIDASGATKAEAIEAVKFVANFLRTGSAYLQLKGLINGYESDSVAQVAELNKRITTTQIELQYLSERAKNLDQLRTRFPQSGTANQQVVEAKDSGAKYLPISTQIVAVNSDINASKESLERTKKRLSQISVLNRFLEQALPLMDQSQDGLVLAKQLLDLQESVLNKVGAGDDNALEVLQGLRSQLLTIQTRFTKSLESNTSPTAKKRGMIKAAAGGLAAAFFLMLLALLGQRVWLNVKSRSIK